VVVRGFQCVKCGIGANSIYLPCVSMMAVFLVSIQRGMSSLFAFRCFPFCFRATFAVGGVTGGVDLDCCVGFRDRLSLYCCFSCSPPPRPPGGWIVSLLSAIPWFGGYVGNWFNGYIGVGRAMAELRWAIGFFFF